MQTNILKYEVYILLLLKPMHLIIFEFKTNGILKMIQQNNSAFISVLISLFSQIPLHCLKHES